LVRAATADEFLKDPLGRYVMGSGYLIWCHGPLLQGTALWGRPGEKEAREVVRLWEFDKRPGVEQPHDVVIDARLLDSVDAGGFEVVSRYVSERMPGYAERVRKEAIITGSLFSGAVVAGLLAITQAKFEWKTFRSSREAYEWLRHPEAMAAYDELERLIETLRGQSAEVRALRHLLDAKEGAISLPDAAHALALSPRSLQRQLRQVGTSFRDELLRVRVQIARRLLADTDLKVEVIAQRLGFATASHFTVAFRNACGTTPSEFRASLRG
jgi:AraC-like DNA-binding protein